MAGWFRSCPLPSLLAQQRRVHGRGLRMSVCKRRVAAVADPYGSCQAAPDPPCWGAGYQRVPEGPNRWRHYMSLEANGICHFATMHVMHCQRRLVPSEATCPLPRGGRKAGWHLGLAAGQQPSSIWRY